MLETRPFGGVAGAEVEVCENKIFEALFVEADAAKVEIGFEDTVLLLMLLLLTFEVAAAAVHLLRLFLSSAWQICIDRFILMSACWSAVAVPPEAGGAVNLGVEPGERMFGACWELGCEEEGGLRTCGCIGART